MRWPFTVLTEMPCGRAPLPPFPGEHRAVRHRRDGGPPQLGPTRQPSARLRRRRRTLLHRSRVPRWGGTPRTTSCAQNLVCGSDDLSGSEGMTSGIIGVFHDLHEVLSSAQLESRLRMPFDLDHHSPPQEEPPERIKGVRVDGPGDRFSLFDLHLRQTVRSHDGKGCPEGGDGPLRTRDQLFSTVLRLCGHVSSVQLGQCHATGRRARCSSVAGDKVPVFSSCLPAEGPDRSALRWTLPSGEGLRSSQEPRERPNH